MNTPHSEPHRETVLAIAAKLRHKPGALLPILHGIQDTLGYIPESSVPLLAHELNLSRAEVHGTLTFYHHFRTTPPGRHTVHVCRAEACQAMGVNRLIDHVKNSLDVDFHGTTADGEISLEPVYCLGNCACSPAIMVDGELHGSVSTERFDEIIGSLKEAS